MRKSIFFTIVCSLCVLNFGGKAATTRGNANVATRSATVSRSATQPSANTSPSVVSRAATKQQKALNTGTKVASATENTTIPSECQDAFYGCMDAFCMLDNASGGRCQCSDRITELDQVLEDILKLDDQTYLMATEGVERIQMGEAADSVIARAKAAGDSVVAKEEAKTRKQSRTLDLSMWDSNIFTADDNLFDDSDNLVSTFADKKGDSLYNASVKMCSAQVPEECLSYGSVLQLVYAQKIKSDCIAYENSLRAQKIQSQQKLQTAQKALRDAALEEYQNQNKYATLGECTIAFTECMQTTAGCGADYTGCVTLAAAENVRSNTAGSRAKQKKIKGAISGADITLAVSTMNQLLGKKQMCESVTKQCVNVNKKDAVWESFLTNAAPALKSAELIAEQNLRSNCLPTLAECYKTACKDNFREEESYDACLSNPELYKSFCKVQLEPCLDATGGSYNNPTASSLWNSLIALLKAVQVDTCTAQVKSCITERCGDDYSECIGLSTESVGNLCPIDSLTACVQDGKYAYADGTGVNAKAIREYVAEVAMGLALQVDNALASACQNAVSDAMIRVCGDTESCESAQIDLSSMVSLIKPMACVYGEEINLQPLKVNTGSVLPLKKVKAGSTRKLKCYANVSVIPESSAENGVVALLTNKPDVSAVTYGESKKFEVPSGYSYLDPEFTQKSTNQVLTILNGALNRVMNSIESDARVQYCLKGRSSSFRGFNGVSNTSNTSDRKFPNLTDSMRATVAEYLLSSLYEQNEELEDRFSDNLDNINDQIANRFGADAVANGEVPNQTNNDEDETLAVYESNYRYYCECDKTKTTKNGVEQPDCLTKTDLFHYVDNDGKTYMTNSRWKGSKQTLTDTEGKYNSSTKKCILRTKKYTCTKWYTRYGGRCESYDEGVILNQREEDMTTYAPANGNINS